MKGGNRFWFFLSALLYFIAQPWPGSAVIDSPNPIGTLAIDRDSRSSLSVCWVTSLDTKRFNEFCACIFAFLSNLEKSPPFRVLGELYLYDDNGTHLLTSDHLRKLQCLSGMRPDVPLRRHLINKTFLYPLTSVHSGAGFPVVVMTRLFLLWDLDSTWILYMDSDLVAVHPFLQEVSSYLQLAPDAPIFAVLDVQSKCPWGPNWREFYEDRQRNTIYNRNKDENMFLYFNSGFLLFRNCGLAKEMMRRVIDMTAVMTTGFQYADQDCLWAFSNSSLYGILPKKFNCMERLWMCPINKCGDETSLYHSHGTPAADRADADFRKLCPT
jgi:hypothetical protein